jgi:predicted adenine nucleotide alpha hydrolase (AANH) superfamily ATPase
MGAHPSTNHDLHLPTPPGGARSVLLHSCCAPCSGSIIERLQQAGLSVAVFFYNPNIHPLSEYCRRKEENRRFADKLGIPFIDGDYHLAPWFALTRGLEEEPERGRRCSACFTQRLEESARQAARLDIPVIATTLGISRWKDLAQVDSCGKKAVDQVAGVDYWEVNWRRKGGAQRMIEVSRREEFYHQEYCGCLYSLRAVNRWREERGRPVIVPEQPFDVGIPPENEP